MQTQLPLRVPGKIVLAKARGESGGHVSIGDDVGWTLAQLSDWKTRATFVSKRAVLEQSGVEEDDALTGWLPERRIDSVRYPRVNAAACACKVAMLTESALTHAAKNDEAPPNLPQPHRDRIVPPDEGNEYAFLYDRVSDGFMISVYALSEQDSLDMVTGRAPNALTPDDAPAVVYDVEFALDRMLRAVSGGEITAASVALAYELYFCLNQPSPQTDVLLTRWEEELAELELGAPQGTDTLIASIRALEPGTSREIAPGLVFHAHALQPVQARMTGASGFRMPGETVIALGGDAPRTRTAVAEADLWLSSAGDLPSRAEIEATKQKLREFVHNHGVAVPPELARSIGMSDLRETGWDPSAALTIVGIILLVIIVLVLSARV